jgi:hypothetical protein
MINIIRLSTARKFFWHTTVHEVITLAKRLLTVITHDGALAQGVATLVDLSVRVNHVA